MAEITECSEHSPPAPSKQEPEQREGFDPDTMRRTKPGVKRLVITLAVLVSFLVGFPFLWKSVEIYRAPLPFDDIELLSKRIESRPLQFPCSFRAIFVGFDPGSNGPDGVDFLKSSISNQMSKFFSKSMQCGTCRNNYSISVIIDSNNDCKQGQNARSSCLYQCGAVNAIDFGGDNERVDDSLESLLGDCSASDGKVYSVVAVNKDVETKAVIGKYRHAWIVGRISEHESVERIAETFVKVFANGGKEEATIHGEFMPVGADGRIVLSFNLLNADPQDWIYDWEFDKIDDHILSPIVDALSPIADISVESQVLYHTPKSSHSYWDDKLRSYIFSTSDLPFFVNSNEWHLDTSVAAGGRSKILHFVVYVPSAEECPLNLQLPNGEISKTNGYVSPMWGGVVVWNPSNCLQDTRRKFPARHKVPAEDLQKIFEVFVGQIRQLFGLKSDNHFIGTSGKYIALASEKGFTEWELDALTRQHACFNIRSCATTLSSLSRLVQSLPRMIIMDEIGKQVKLSMEAAKHAEGDASYGIYDASAVSSRQARALAEDAFFHPSIMSVSYYSFEHCFAVYSPFFLPVSLHVLLAALREWRRYQQEKRKHLTWKARTVAAS